MKRKRHHRHQPPPSSVIDCRLRVARYGRVEAPNREQLDRQRAVAVQAVHAVLVQAVLIATLALFGAHPGKTGVKKEGVVSRAGRKTGGHRI